jgi:hypothetical protein
LSENAHGETRGTQIFCVGAGSSGQIDAAFQALFIMAGGFSKPNVRSRYQSHVCPSVLALTQWRRTERRSPPAIWSVEENRQSGLRNGLIGFKWLLTCSAWVFCWQYLSHLEGAG